MGPLDKARNLLKEKEKLGYFTGKPGVVEVVYRLADNEIQGAVPAKEVKIGTRRKTVMRVEGCQGHLGCACVHLSTGAFRSNLEDVPIGLPITDVMKCALFPVHLNHERRVPGNIGDLEERWTRVCGLGYFGEIVNDLCPTVRVPTRLRCLGKMG